MSDLSTKRLIAQYQEDAGAPMFLSGYFPTPPSAIHNSEKVEIDVQRSGRPIAIVVTDWKSGGNKSTQDLYTNKEFIPPLLDEEFVLNSGNLMTREFGRTPFEDPDFMGRAQRTLRSGVAKNVQKIRRTVELQSAQILQTGEVSLIDNAGNTIYTLDFGMKSTHKAYVSVDWDETNADPIADLEAGDTLVRKDSGFGITDVILGESAWPAFRSRESVLKLLDNRRFEIGGIAPVLQSDGQVFQGRINVHGRLVNIYTYDASYDHPQTSADTPYIDPWAVIGIARNAPRLLTFGGIPRIVPVDPRLAALGVGSMAAPSQGLALTTNAWVDPKGTTITASVATRVLAIPVAIDAHFCFDAKQS